MAALMIASSSSRDKFTCDITMGTSKSLKGCNHNNYSYNAECTAGDKLEFYCSCKFNTGTNVSQEEYQGELLTRNN